MGSWDNCPDHEFATSIHIEATDPSDQDDMAITKIRLTCEGGLEVTSAKLEGGVVQDTGSGSGCSGGYAKVFTRIQSYQVMIDCGCMCS